MRSQAALESREFRAQPRLSRMQCSRNREAGPQAADPYDGGRMKHSQTAVLFAGRCSVLRRGMSVSPPISAAEPPAAKATASATPAASDGALFVEFVSVLRHPRCMNCHSQGDFPRQGNDGHPHSMNVRRGPEGHGVTAEKCSTCHQDHNLAGAHMPPGAPNWGLPPPNMPMIWQGLTRRTDLPCD